MLGRLACRRETCVRMPAYRPRIPLAQRSTVSRQDSRRLPGNFAVVERPERGIPCFAMAGLTVHPGNLGYEVARNLVRTDHIFYSAYVAMNPGVFQRQPPEVQQALLEAGRETTPYNLDLAKQANQADLDSLVKAGLAVM